MRALNMEFDALWLLLGLPVAFAAGWLASRWDGKQVRLENRRAPKAYFRGLNHLLNQQQDKAIDAFVEAVQHDPDTSDLHFALGNLFRRRGDYDRAVRVHQHLLARGDLSRADRDRAQHALAMDYLKAGLIDRAEAAFKPLLGTPLEGQALLALLALYERSRDWSQAAQVAQTLQASGESDFSHRVAHYRCEQAQAALSRGDVTGARLLLQQAQTAAPDAARPVLDLAQLEAAQAEGAETAIELLLRLLAKSKGLPGGLSASPAAVLAAEPLARWVELRHAAEPNTAGATLNRAIDVLQQRYADRPSLDVLDALARLMQLRDGNSDAVHLAWAQHLSQHPSLVAAQRWLTMEYAAEADQTAPTRRAVLRAVDHAARPLMRYRCAACGFEARQYFWQCPGCQAWDSYPPQRVEEL
jgi:lipopolysaccharide assembly protein B